MQARHSITAGNLTLLPPPTTKRMPRIAHFIFGLSPDFGGKSFSLVHYLAIRSAHDRLGPKWNIFVRPRDASSHSFSLILQFPAGVLLPRAQN
jgi:hypothetical protein